MKRAKAEQDPKPKAVSTAGAKMPSKAKKVAGAIAEKPVEVQQIPLSRIKANPSNPRVLRDAKFAKLKRSIQDFPDMLNYRTLVAVTDTDGKLMVLGGNMRLRAMQDLGVKTAPVMLADHWTDEQRREFTVKDNVGYGEWNWDELANEWDAEDLSDWGLDLPIAQDFTNKEVDTDGFGDEVVIKLHYSEADHAKVRDALSRVASTPEQAVWKLLELK